MQAPLLISFSGYTVLRLPREVGAAHDRYVVVRPDGSECCRGVDWAAVERSVDQDAARTSGTATDPADVGPSSGNSRV
ncbi:MAG TPA: hypothetical protein VF796_15750 [Humisphaera sp.]